jgi:hypothetical protein
VYFVQPDMFVGLAMRAITIFLGCVTYRAGLAVNLRGKTLHLI